MATCPGCGQSYRKGSTVLLLTDPPRNARVCASCRRRGVFLVAPTVAPIYKVVGTRGGVVDAAIRQLRTYARAASAASSAAEGVETPAGSGRHAHPQAAHHLGRAEAFEGAIALLQSLSKAGA